MSRYTRWIETHGIVRAEPGEFFTFASGTKAPSYVDMRRVLLEDPEALGAFTNGLCNKLSPSVTRLGAVPTGGMILLGPMLVDIDENISRDPVLGFYVRSSAKQHGLARQIEGADVAGKVCALVEDTVSTGGSVCAAIAAIQEAGGVVEQVLACLDRDLGGRAAIEATGATFTALVHASELDL